MHLEAAGGGCIGDSQRQRHFVELGLLVLILRHEQNKLKCGYMDAPGHRLLRLGPVLF